MNENGRGVPHDMVPAAQWYGRSSASGRPVSRFTEQAAAYVAPSARDRQNLHARMRFVLRSHR